jgi:hypothetical protein
VERRTIQRNGHGPVVSTAGRRGSDERGSGADLDDAKAQFRIAWAQIRASLTDQDIASAHRIAEISTEALARYGRGHWR